MPKRPGKRKALTPDQIRQGVGLNRGAWRTLARRYNTGKLYGPVLVAGREYAAALLTEVLCTAVTLAEHDKRKTLMQTHVTEAFKVLGFNVLVSE